MQMLSPNEDREMTQGIYDTVRSRRPGFPAVDEKWHRRLVSDPVAYRDGYAQLRTTVVLDDDGPRGFVRHAFKPDWSKGFADGTVGVRHMLAVDPAAEAALWRYLIEWDLSGRVSHWNCPSDDPIQYWLDEPRHSTRQVDDQLYIKLMDVPAALEGRTYAQPIDVVIDVTDDDIGENNRRWRLSGDSNGAKCAATSDAADMELRVSSLGAVYLGGPSVQDLAKAGWIRENTPGALEAASDAFSHPHAPFSPYVF
jgi:predicted acetyltransferase